jgi:hypothetical protein
MSAEGEPLRVALAYAAAGWPVHPCKPDSKEPDTAHGFKDATTDPARIRAWWSAAPERNVAIATGIPGPDVLDVDVKPDGDGWAAFSRLKRAGVLAGARALVRTRSGGLHVYFAGTLQGCHSLPRHKLDFKSAGGYVLAPPSRVGGKAYEILDHRPRSAALDWVRVTAILSPPRPARPTVPARPVVVPGELPPAVRRALEAPAEDRSAAMHRLIGACVRAGLDAPAIHELAASYEPAVSKYGPRLRAEVERSLDRIGAAW